jgi:hypothetical protein
MRIQSAARLAIVCIALGAGTLAASPVTAQVADEFPITWTPTSGPTGTTVSVSGSGCVPPVGQSAGVEIRLADAGPASIVLGLESTNADGTFAFDVFIPPLVPPFAYSGSAICVFSGFAQLFSAFNFEVTPPTTAPTSTGALTLGSATVEAGGSTSVTAPLLTGPGQVEGTCAGFAPSQDVKFVLYPGAIVIGQTPATAAGLNSTLTIPAGTAPGDYTVVAFGSYLTALPCFTALTASLTVTPAPTTTTAAPTTTVAPTVAPTTAAPTTAVATTTTPVSVLPPTGNSSWPLVIAVVAASTGLGLVLLTRVRRE